MTEVAEILDRQAADVDRRSLQVSGFDVAFALVGFAYLDEGKRVELNRLASSEESRLSALGVLSDSVWNRYGVSSLSYANLAYWAEVCRAYPGWDTVERPDGLAGVAVLGYHDPCRLIEDSNAPTHVDLPSDKVCIGGSSLDSVVGPSALTSWSAVTDSAVVFDSREAQHNGETALASCTELFASELSTG